MKILSHAGHVSSEGNWTSCWVKIRTQEVETFMEHLKSVDSNIELSKEDLEENKLSFLDCAIHLEKDGGLNIEFYQKPTHTGQYLLFNSHRPLEHMLGVIRT